MHFCCGSRSSKVEAQQCDHPRLAALKIQPPKVCKVSYQCRYDPRTWHRRKPTPALILLVVLGLEKQRQGDPSEKVARIDTLLCKSVFSSKQSCQVCCTRVCWYTEGLSCRIESRRFHHLAEVWTESSPHPLANTSGIVGFASGLLPNPDAFVPNFVQSCCTNCTVM